MLYEQKHGFDSDYFKMYAEADLTCPVHLHRCMEVVFVEEGEMTVTVGDRDWPVTAGDCVVIWSNQAHAFRTDTHSRHRLCVFAPELVNRFFASHGEQIPLCPVIRGEQAALCGTLLQSLSGEESVLRAKGVLYVLAGEIERYVTFRRRARGRHAEGAVLLSQILTYMNENLTGDCSMGAIARELCYDKAYLARFFSKNVGISPAQYVLQMRLTKASELLLDTEDSVISVGIASGFNSLRTFNRTFLARYGLSPTQYRALGAEGRELPPTMAEKKTDS